MSVYKRTKLADQMAGCCNVPVGSHIVNRCLMGQGDIGYDLVDFERKSK